MLGAEGQIRTDDTRLFRAVLYQLSYLGAGRIGRSKDTDAPMRSQPDVGLRLQRALEVELIAHRDVVGAGRRQIRLPATARVDDDARS